MQKDPASPGKNHSIQRKENGAGLNSPKSKPKRLLKSPEKPFFRSNKPRIGLNSLAGEAVRAQGEPIRPQGDFCLASTIYQRPTPTADHSINSQSVEHLLAFAEEQPEPAYLEAMDETEGNVAQAMDIDEAPGVDLPAIAIIQPQAQPAAVAQVVEVLHLRTYGNRPNTCPEFLQDPKKLSHKTIFSLLYAQGQLFLCADSNKVRYWGPHPSHHQIVIQPQQEPRNQFYLSKRPDDVKYPGTWVSAIVKTPDNQFYPLHIITKSTLGAVSNAVRYPNNIMKLFPAEKFPICWPQGLGKECLIICVDTPEQKRKLIEDYKTLVTSEVTKNGESLANRKIPNLRVYCKGQLSTLLTVQNSTQQRIYTFLKPDLRPYIAKQIFLLEIETREVKARRGELELETFNTVCKDFFSPEPLSHEIALTHFSLTQLLHFSGVLTQSRNRMIDLKAKLYKQYHGPQMQDPHLINFVLAVSQTIYERTSIITKLEKLATKYIEYSTQLSNLLIFAPSPHIEEVEQIIYGKIQDLMQINHYDNAAFQKKFTSGRALISWMLTHEIRIPANNTASLADTIAEHLPRPESRAIRAF